MIVGIVIREKQREVKENFEEKLKLKVACIFILANNESAQLFIT
jgi:hypothetical protein